MGEEIRAMPLDSAAGIQPIKSGDPTRLGASQSHWSFDPENSRVLS
jgi:hypothetical protein